MAEQRYFERQQLKPAYNEGDNEGPAMACHGIRSFVVSGDVQSRSSSAAANVLSEGTLAAAAATEEIEEKVVGAVAHPVISSIEMYGRSFSSTSSCIDVFASPSDGREVRDFSSVDVDAYWCERALLEAAAPDSSCSESTGCSAGSNASSIRKGEVEEAFGHIPDAEGKLGVVATYARFPVEPSLLPETAVDQDCSNKRLSVKSEVQKLSSVALPFGLPKSVLLCIYMLYAFLTGCVYFGWPSLSYMLLSSGAYAWRCPRDENGVFLKDLRKAQHTSDGSSAEETTASEKHPGETHYYICDEQDSAVAPLFSVAYITQSLMSVVAGTLVDHVSPKKVAIAGQLLNATAWILLSQSSESFSAYIPSMVFVGLGADTAYLPTLLLATLFPGNHATLIMLLGAANTASFAVPLLLEKLWRWKPMWSFSNVCIFYVCVGPLFCVVLAALFIPWTSFAEEERKVQQRSRQDQQQTNTAACRTCIRCGLFVATAPSNARAPLYLNSRQRILRWMQRFCYHRIVLLVRHLRRNQQPKRFWGRCCECKAAHERQGFDPCRMTAESLPLGYYCSSADDKQHQRNQQQTISHSYASTAAANNNTDANLSPMSRKWCPKWCFSKVSVPRASSIILDVPEDDGRKLLNLTTTSRSSWWWWSGSGRHATSVLAGGAAVNVQCSHKDTKDFRFSGATTTVVPGFDSCCEGALDVANMRNSVWPGTEQQQKPHVLCTDSGNVVRHSVDSEGAAVTQAAGGDTSLEQMANKTALPLDFWSDVVVQPQQQVGDKAASGVSMGRCECEQEAAIQSEESEKDEVSFCSQLFSSHFVCIVLYWSGMAVAVSFFQSASSRLFSTKLLNFMDLALSFAFIPCIGFGKAIDLLGPFPTLFLVNSMGLLAYCCSIGAHYFSDGANSAAAGGAAASFGDAQLLPLQYLAVLAFCVYVSVDCEQVFCYVESTFDPRHFGKLSGLALTVGGALSLVSVPLYHEVTIHLLNRNPLPVCCGLAVVLLLLYFALGSMWFLRRKYPPSFKKKIASNAVLSTNPIPSRKPRVLQSLFVSRSAAEPDRVLLQNQQQPSRCTTDSETSSSFHTNSHALV